MNYTRISAVFTLAKKPPYFIGSQVRGAFGYALKKVVCINPSYVCDGCFASKDCLFFEFFEERNSFHKYRLDFELGLDRYRFDILLFDAAVSKLAYVLSALNMLISQIGLGKENLTTKEFELYINDEKSIVDGKIKIPANPTKIFEIDKICQDIELQLITPLRLKKKNRFARADQLELADIINSIYQRKMRLQGEDHKRFPYEIRGEIVGKNLEFKELVRKSNRQKTVMNMGGIVGTMSIKNLDEKSFALLKLGELIGVGKQTVFGLGKIIVKERLGV